MFVKVEGPVTVRDLNEVEESERMSGLALVGPKAIEVLARIAPDVSNLQPSNFIPVKIAGEAVILTRDSMGEIDYYHIFTNPSHVLDLWNLILKKGAEH